MKLILQAIKSIFRKVDKRLSDLSTRIQTAQATADTAQATADSLVVTVRYVNNVPVISHTNEEIYNAHQSYRRVVLSVEDNDTGIITNSSLICGVYKDVAMFITRISRVTGSNNYISIECNRIENNTFISNNYLLSEYNG